MDYLNGRINRATYFMLLAALVGMTVVIAVAMPDGRLPGELMLAFIVIPRLHDLGRSGWYALGILLIEIVGLVVILSQLPFDQTSVGIGIMAIVMLVVAIGLGLVPGQAGPNRFGAQPKPGIQWGKTPKR